MHTNSSGSCNRGCIAISHIGNTHTHTHTHTSGARESRREREGGRGRLCPCGRMQLRFQSSHVRSCIIPIGSRIFHRFLVPLAACGVSPNFVDLNKCRETAKRPIRRQTDVEMTSNHARKIDKAKAERWLK